MPWSLVEALAETGQRRPFYLPLASGSPDFSEVGPDQYDPENDRTSDPNDPRLHITISPPQSGQFANQGPLPDPAIRLYAIGAAWVRFNPAQAPHKDSLELKLAVFASFILHKSAVGGQAFPLWWERWLEAGCKCIPHLVIYENVDATLLREALENVQAPIDNQFENRVLPTLGLQFPYSVTKDTRAEFIDHFMAGDQNAFMVAEAGAHLGAAAPENAASTDPNANRLLTLHARYHDHTETSPHPMNPLELFNLLFGNDSNEATSHPLLLKLDTKGRAQSGHESKSMRLRPPLRTHARLMWEANIEIVDEIDGTGATPEGIFNSPKWRPESDVKERLYNDYDGIDESGTARHFDRWAYDKCKGDGCYKCNLFVLDVALRAGFRVLVDPLKNTSVWHYREPNGIVNLIRQSQVSQGQQPLARAPIIILFKNKLKTKPLAWNVEGMLRSVDFSGLKEEINRQMTQEGRCFVVAGSRIDNSGHMVLVESVSDDDQIFKLALASSSGHGFSAIVLQTREATTFGAKRLARSFTLDGGYSAIYLFELHPGKDPDTPLGLQDCNGAVYVSD